MHLKRLYQFVNKVMCDTGSIAHVVFCLIDIHYMVPYGPLGKIIILYYRPN